MKNPNNQINNENQFYSSYSHFLCNPDILPPNPMIDMYQMYFAGNGAGKNNNGNNNNIRKNKKPFEVKNNSNVNKEKNYL